MENICKDCGYYDPVVDYCVLRRFEAEEKFLFYDYDGDIECPDKVCSIKEIVEELKKAFIRKEYKKMLLALDDLAKILWYYNHKDLENIAHELYGDILELEGYDYQTSEFKPTLNQNQKLRLEQEIFQKYKDFLEQLSYYFII